VDESCTFKPAITKTTEQLALQRRLRMLNSCPKEITEDYLNDEE